MALQSDASQSRRWQRQQQRGRSQLWLMRFWGRGKPGSESGSGSRGRRVTLGREKTAMPKLLR